VVEEGAAVSPVLVDTSVFVEVERRSLQALERLETALDGAS
jgi:hypothetical protein